MKNNKNIVIISILVILIIITIVILIKKNLKIEEENPYQKYECTFVQDASLYNEINYVFYYEDDKIIESVLTKTYKAKKFADRETLATLINIIKTENEQNEANENLEIEELKSTSSVYIYKIKVKNVQEQEDSEIGLYETYKSLEEIKEYFSQKTGTTCN